MVLHGAFIPLVDVLLRILAGEVDVMVRLPQLVGARLIGMTIRDIETARITRIPFCKPFREVQVQEVFTLCLGWGRIISYGGGQRSHVPWCPSCHD